MAKYFPGPYRTHGDRYIEAGDNVVVARVELSPLSDQVRATQRLLAGAPELLEAVKAQHNAIDTLFALLIAHCPSFLPSKSGKPWEALLQGNAAVAKVEGRDA